MLNFVLNFKFKLKIILHDGSYTKCLILKKKKKNGEIALLYIRCSRAVVQSIPIGKWVPLCCTYLLVIELVTLMNVLNFNSNI